MYKTSALPLSYTPIFLPNYTRKIPWWFEGCHGGAKAPSAKAAGQQTGTPSPKAITESFLLFVPLLYTIKLVHRLPGLRVEVVDRIHVGVDLIHDPRHRRVRHIRAIEA